MTQVAEATRLVTFRVGSGLFAVDVTQVERVVRYESPRKVPRLPDWIEGLMEYDGRVIPVVDLRRRLEQASLEEIGAQTRLLLLDVGGRGDWCGMVVDQVLDVRAFGVESMAPPPELVRGLAGRVYTGTVKRDGDLVVVLDLKRLFSEAERRKLSQAEKAAVNA